MEEQPGKHECAPLLVGTHQSSFPYWFVTDDDELAQSVFCVQLVVHHPPLPPLVHSPDAHWVGREQASPMPRVAESHAPLHRCVVHDRNAERSLMPPGYLLWHAVAQELVEQLSMHVASAEHCALAPQVDPAAQHVPLMQESQVEVDELKPPQAAAGGAVSACAASCPASCGSLVPESLVCVPASSVSGLGPPCAPEQAARGYAKTAMSVAAQVIDERFCM